MILLLQIINSITHTHTHEKVFMSIERGRVSEYFSLSSNVICNITPPNIFKHMRMNAGACKMQQNYCTNKSFRKIRGCPKKKIHTVKVSTSIHFVVFLSTIRFRLFRDFGCRCNIRTECLSLPCKFVSFFSAVYCKMRINIETETGHKMRNICFQDRACSLYLTYTACLSLFRLTHSPFMDP